MAGGAASLLTNDNDVLKLSRNDPRKPLARRGDKMQFSREGDLFKALRVTGPTHNYLGLVFGGTDGADIDVYVADIKPDEAKTLDAGPVALQVLEGIDAAKLAPGTNYRVQRIQFVPSDSSPVDTYRMFAMKLAEHVAGESAFRVFDD